MLVCIFCTFSQLLCDLLSLELNVARGIFQRGGKFTENQYVKGCIKYYVILYGSEYDIR